jgi:prepilin-type processing-associated H-X9-DG protein
LRQIGLAFHNLHDQLESFPTGGWDWWSTPAYDSGRPLAGEFQKAGWGFQILPYVEAENVWKGGGPDAGDLDRIRVAVGTPNRVFFCPTRRRPQTVLFSDPGYLDGTPVTTALCDYAASNYEETGVLRYRYPTRLADITDGTSNTLLAGDKRLNLRFLGRTQPDDDTGYATGFANDVIRRTDRPPAPDYQAETGDGDWRFGSSHPGRFNALFADGSVRALSYTIDPTVFSFLGNKNDGQTYSGNEF